MAVETWCGLVKSICSKTIQILRPGAPPSDRATRQIRGLMELKELL
jgi:hypothetical protein